jgi:hypothetical protein
MQFGCYCHCTGDELACMTCGINSGGAPDFFCEGSGMVRMVRFEEGFTPPNGCIQLNEEYITSIRNISLLDESGRQRRYFSRTNRTDRKTKRNRDDKRGPGSGKTSTALRILFHWFVGHDLAYYVSPSNMLCRQFHEDAAKMRLNTRAKPEIYIDPGDDVFADGLHIMTYHRFAMLQNAVGREIFIIFDECHVLLEPFYMQQAAKIIMSGNTRITPRLMLTGATAQQTVGKLNTIFDYCSQYEFNFRVVVRNIVHYDGERWKRVLTHEINRLRGHTGCASGIVVFLKRKADVERLYVEQVADFKPVEVYVPTPSIVFMGKRTKEGEMKAYAEVVNAVRILAPQGIHYIHAKVGK